MLFTITTTYNPATDLGFVLHKNPARCQAFDLSLGKAYVFYPEATAQRCTAALLLDVDPVGMVRKKAGWFGRGPLAQYVNDRPYVASSFLSVAISRVFGTALQGKCPKRPDLEGMAMPLKAGISVVPARGEEGMLQRLFEPLGYVLRTTRHVLDARFPQWGDSPYYTVELEKETTPAELLRHVFVLIPVLDNAKHYFVGDDEIDKLLEKGRGWLSEHPEREFITRRYLKHRMSLARQALARLADEDGVSDEAAGLDQEEEDGRAEREPALNEVRQGTVLAALRAADARRVLDIGCGEGRLLRVLAGERQFEEIVGMDVSVRALEIAADRLHLDRAAPAQKKRIRLLHGSLMYRDARLNGFDAAAVVEVVEHLDPPRLAAFERVLFEFARPGTVALTTPNREYNVRWENVGADRLRHWDHRFEWTRREFREWADRVARHHGYSVRFLPVGPEDGDVGAPTQMGVFSRVG